MLVFKNSIGKEIDPINYTLNIMKRYPDVEIHIGTDSYSLSDQTKYVTAIAYRYKEAGVHYIHSKQTVPKIKDIWTRLWKETELSIQIAQELKSNKKISLEIDMDYNEDNRFYSNKLVSVAKGWANSLGFKVNIKPYRQIATSAADYLSK